MKHCLLLCAAALALALAVPASAQYVFLDVNGDGACTSADVLDNTVTSIDVWFDTNHDKNGNPVTCPTGEDLTMSSYTFILSSTGGVSYGTWVDEAGFTAPAGGAAAGNDIWLARVTSTTALPPGKIKVGHMPITVTGSPVISILSSDPSLDGTALTSFGSQCLGQDFDNTMKLGPCGVGDFCDACGTSAGTPATKTTWGKIKDLYRGQ